LCEPCGLTGTLLAGGEPCALLCEPCGLTGTLLAGGGPWALLCEPCGLTGTLLAGGEPWVLLCEPCDLTGTLLAGGEPWVLLCEPCGLTGTLLCGTCGLAFKLLLLPGGDLVGFAFSFFLPNQPFILSHTFLWPLPLLGVDLLVCFVFGLGLLDWGFSTPFCTDIGLRAMTLFWVFWFLRTFEACWPAFPCLLTAVGTLLTETLFTGAGTLFTGAGTFLTGTGTLSLETGGAGGDFPAFFTSRSGCLFLWRWRIRWPLGIISLSNMSIKSFLK